MSTAPPSARTRPIVAIDGPAGAGKSTVASHLARRFGFLNLETGAMYRALALKAMQSGVSFADEAALMRLAGETRIALEPQHDGNRVLLDGETVSQRLREPDVTAAASQVSVHPLVRHWMVEQQRALGLRGGVVMEGRDIGTVVFPDAEVKIFLDADPEVRGSRRFQQIEPAAESSSAARAEIVRELKERDARDRSRAESPLRPAPDAQVIDTTQMTLDQVLQETERIVEATVRRSQA